MGGWPGETKQLERTSPSQGLKPTEHLAWHATFIAIDPNDHDDGQKVAIEQSQIIGDPASILKSLAKSMSVVENSPYEVQVFPIVERGSFWRFAKEHHDQIKSITFDVAVPNMFNGADDFQNEMKRLRDDVNVSNV